MITVAAIHESLAGLRREYQSAVLELAEEGLQRHPEDECSRDEWLREKASLSRWTTEPHRAAVVVLTSRAAQESHADVVKAPLPKVLELAASTALWQDATKLAAVLELRRASKGARVTP